MGIPNGNDSANNENKAPKVEIEIKRHQQLFELLSDPNRMWRVLLSLFLIIVVLFCGIAFVVIAIKKYYPYNIIDTNIQGATTMKTEDKEVIYWLFNTADLWANSGIEVKEGDELTIRASGASFTAIHHLVKASDENYKPNDEWVGTGGQRKDDPRDKLRAEYRINKNYDEGILLMQIVPKDSTKNDNESWIKGHPNMLTDGHVEIIGKERRNLRISEDGTLHFAVNDIVLTDTVLKKMYKQWINSLVDEDIIEEKYFNSIYNKMRCGDVDSLITLNNQLCKDCIDSLIEITDTSIQIKKKKFNPNSKKWMVSLNKYITDNKNQLVKKYQENDKSNDSLIKYITSNCFSKVIEDSKIGLSLGRHPQKDSDACYNAHYEAYPLVNELNYYKEKRFYNAWYVDNLGSFLIVIERKKQ